MGQPLRIPKEFIKKIPPFEGSCAPCNLQTDAKQYKNINNNYNIVILPIIYH